MFTMKAFKLWMEPDQALPEFKRLRFAETDVSVQDIITRGIHPESMIHDFYTNESCGLNVRIMDVLNEKDMKIPGIMEFGYCTDISVVPSYYYRRDDFTVNAEKISENICFTESLDYSELITIAKRRLTDTWSHKVAVNLAKRIYHEFNHLRDFLKKKDKNIKLSGYKDLDKYQIHTIVSLQDFDGHDKAIISCGIPNPNFRKTAFIRRITTPGGYLSLTDGFDQFSIIVSEGDDECKFELTCRCRRDGDMITIMPDAGDDKRKRRMALEFAQRWSVTGTFCFTVSLDIIAEMIETPGLQISFKGIRYKGSNDCQIPEIKVNGSRVERYAVGRYPTFQSTNEKIKGILQAYGVSMTGKKEALIEKIAKLSVFLYSEFNDTLNEYFTTRKYIKIPRLEKDREKSFPLLGNLDLGQMVLAMYIVRHLRGNVILDSTHVNDTYELIDLARALICSKIEVNGVFVRVETIEQGGNNNENSKQN